MKKKLLSISFILTLLLSGCGSSIDSNTDMTPHLGISEDANASETVYDTEEPTTEEITTEEMTTEEVTTEEEIIPVGPVDISSVHGILVYSQDFDNSKVDYYEGTNVRKCNIFTVGIYLIEEDGYSTCIRTFTNSYTKSCNMADFGTSSTQKLYQKFNSNLTKMVAKKEMDNGEYHVGWIDLDGNFTDVSELVTVKTDFSPLTCHETTGFGPDNYYYFADWSDDSTDLYSPNRVMKRVPVDNLTPEAVEIVLDSYSWNNAYICPDGSIGYSYYYYDASLSYPACGPDCYDWLDIDKAVSTNGYKDNQVVINTFDGTDSYNNVCDSYVVVDSVSGRCNYCPVLSPDKSQIAFLSGLTTENGGVNSLYIVPIEGGTPTKLETQFYFGPPSNAYIVLMDWL